MEMATDEKSVSTKRELEDENGDQEAKKLKLDAEDNQSDQDPSASVISKNESDQGGRRRGKRLKYAMLLSYSGRAYYGMQIQKEASLPTIEQQILDVLLELRLIDEKDRAKTKQFWFQRAARTDKGVSAVRQVCSMMLPLRDNKNSKGDQDEYTVANLPQAMNDRLPQDIRIIGIKRATRAFDAKNACESRTYAYTLPSFAFARNHEDSKDFRISAERLLEVNEILSMYQGTHNYFNFTCRRPATDASCKRYIIRCQAGKPFVREDMEFVTVHLTGQSFMLHQIRKMIGLCIAIVQGYTDRSAIKKSWEPIRFDVPIAPSLGLVLDEVHYDYYNKKFASTHEPIDFSEFQEKVDDFREKYIDSVIVETEKNEGCMLKWLKTLNCHEFTASASATDNKPKASKMNESDDEADNYDSD